MGTAQTIYKNRGTYHENKDTFFKTKTVTGSTSWTRISHEERKFMVDSRTSVHMMSKSDLFTSKKKQLRKSKEFCTIITVNGSNTTTEEATVHARNVWKIHQPYSRWKKYAKNIGMPTNGRKDNRPH